MTTLSFDCSPQPKGGGMTPEREVEGTNMTTELALATTIRDLTVALDAERERVAKLERVAELVKEDRFSEDYKGKLTVTHGRFFSAQHRPDTYCPICEALAALKASDE